MKLLAIKLVVGQARDQVGINLQILKMLMEQVAKLEVGTKVVFLLNLRKLGGLAGIQVPTEEQLKKLVKLLIKPVVQVQKELAQLKKQMELLGLQGGTKELA